MNQLKYSLERHINYQKIQAIFDELHLTCEEFVHIHSLKVRYGGLALKMLEQPLKSLLGVLFQDNDTA